MIAFLDKLIKTVEHPKRAKDIYVPIDKALEIGKRIGLVLVTKSGNSNEKLLGIISAWEVVAR